MINNRKLDLFKDEITRCKQQISSLQFENTDLKSTIKELNGKDQEKQEFINGMLQEFESLKAEHDECMKQLREYKNKYIKLLGDLMALRKHYKKEFGILMGDMKRS